MDFTPDSFAMNDLDEEDEESTSGPGEGEGAYPDDYEDCEPSEQEVLEYCEWLGMDAEQDKQLVWIAREALKAPLPENWRICYTDERELYYFNVRTGDSIWDHPMDSFYKALFRQEKTKLEKKRKKMRLHPGSHPIMPFQNFFSDVADRDGTVNIPEHLLDPIDFRLFIDPVVLHTSGRTVSKHTIVNNKWRDPFSRDYVQNKYLIPNIDKKNEVNTWMISEFQSYCQTYVLNSSSFAHVMKFIPFILDQECEASLKAQYLLLVFLKKMLSTPADCMSPPPSGCTSARRGRKPKPERNTPRHASQAYSLNEGPQLPAPPLSVAISPDTVGFRELLRLSEEDLNTFLSCLLTMGTAASLEALYIVLANVPSLRSHKVFKGFSSEILNVLRLSEKDIEIILSSCAKKNTPNEDSLPSIQSKGDEKKSGSDLVSIDVNCKTTNADHLITCKWILLLMEYPHHLNILEKTLDWRSTLQLVAIIANSDKDSVTAANRMIRSVEGWPSVMGECGCDLVAWVCEMALKDTNPWNQIILVFDLLMNVTVGTSLEAAIETVKKNKSTLLASLHSASAQEPQSGTSYAAMLGALLIYWGCCALHDFESNPELEIRVAHDLLPRLTRQQWKPKHFESTLNYMIDKMQRDTEFCANFAVVRSRHIGRPVAFLMKELSKKRKSFEDLRAALDVVESREAKTQAATAKTTLLIMQLGLQLQAKKKSASMERNVSAKDLECSEFENKTTLLLIQRLKEHRANLLYSRSQNVCEVLRLLLTLRLKPKRDKCTGKDIRLPLLKHGFELQDGRKRPSKKLGSDPYDESETMD